MADPGPTPDVPDEERTALDRVTGILDGGAGLTVNKGVRAELELVLAELEAGVGAPAALAQPLEVADTADARLTAALARAQAAFPAIHKNRTGEVRGTSKTGADYAYSYSYADIADVLSAVRPALAANGLAVVQRTHYTDGGRLLLLTELRHVGGGILDSVIELAQNPGNHQQFGGALTYLRRYELTTLLGVAAEEDRDGADVTPVGRPGSSEPTVVEREVLPAWAQPASLATVTKLTAALAFLLDDDEAAVGFLDAVASNAGGAVPTVVTRTLLGLGVRLGVDVDTAVEAYHARQQARDAQGAAEAPDPPAPDAGVDQAADEVTAELERAQQPDGNQPADPEPSPRDLDEAAILEQRDAARAQASDADRPAPGSYAGKLNLLVTGDVYRNADVDTKRKMIRDLGCTCADPIAGERDDCPAHGIPF